MKTFAEYDAFIAESGKPAGDPTHAERLSYATLKLNGEAGEVAELVGKSMRGTRSGHAETAPLDPVKLTLELGDVLWYVGRIAALHDVKLEDVATINREKLLRRAAVGKDPAGELEMARRTLETRRQFKALCAGCFETCARVGSHYWSTYCEATGGLA